MPREVDTQVARVELPLCAAAARVEGRAALVLGVREAGPATETQRMLGLWWHVGVDALARPETASQGQRSQSVARLPLPRTCPSQRKKGRILQCLPRTTLGTKGRKDELQTLLGAGIN